MTEQNNTPRDLAKRGALAAFGLVAAAGAAVIGNRKAGAQGIIPPPGVNLQQVISTATGIGSTDRTNLTTAFANSSEQAYLGIGSVTNYAPSNPGGGSSVNISFAPKVKVDLAPSFVVAEMGGSNYDALYKIYGGNVISEGVHVSSSGSPGTYYTAQLTSDGATTGTPNYAYGSIIQGHIIQNGTWVNQGTGGGGVFLNTGNLQNCKYLQNTVVSSASSYGYLLQTAILLGSSTQTTNISTTSGSPTITSSINLGSVSSLPSGEKYVLSGNTVNIPTGSTLISGPTGSGPYTYTMNVNALATSSSVSTTCNTAIQWTLDDFIIDGGSVSAGYDCLAINCNNAYGVSQGTNGRISNLKLIGLSTSYSANNGFLISVASGSDIVFSNIVGTCATASGEGAIHVEDNSQRLLFSNIKMYNCPTNGIEIYGNLNANPNGVGGYCQISDVHVNDSLFYAGTSNTYAGFYVNPLATLNNPINCGTNNSTYSGFEFGLYVGISDIFCNGNILNNVKYGVSSQSGQCVGRSTITNLQTGGAAFTNLVQGTSGSASSGGKCGYLSIRSGADAQPHIIKQFGTAAQALTLTEGFDVYIQIPTLTGSANTTVNLFELPTNGSIRGTVHVSAIINGNPIDAHFDLNWESGTFGTTPVVSVGSSGTSSFAFGTTITGTSSGYLTIAIYNGGSTAISPSYAGSQVVFIGEYIKYS